MRDDPLHHRFVVVKPRYQNSPATIFPNQDVCPVLREFPNGTSGVGHGNHVCSLHRSGIRSQYQHLHQYRVREGAVGSLINS